MTSRHGLLLAVLLTFVVHWPVLDNGFVYDDNHVARAYYADAPNPRIAELRPIAEYFGLEYWTSLGQLRIFSSPLYRPITVWSFALTHAIWPGEPGDPYGPGTSEAFPHHLINLLLQVLAVALVFLFVRRLTRSAWACFVAALVFGVHALHVEVVAACVGRADLLGFCCGLGALLVWLEGQEAATWRRKVLWFAASAILLFVAFCSKESALPWVALFPFAGAIVRRDDSVPWIRAAGPQVGWTVLAATLPVLSWFLLRSAAFADLPDKLLVAYTSNPLFDAPTADRVLTGTKIWGYGLYKTLFPLHLACDYGPEVFATVRSVLDPWFLVAAGALSAAGIATLVCGRRNPLLFLAGAIWVGFSFPTTNVPFAIGTVFGERLYYGPSLGFALLCAWVVWGAGARRRAVLAVVLAWCAGSGVRTFLRCNDWQDERTLFVGDAAAQPRSLLLLRQAAQVEREDGNRAGERDYLERMIALQPDFGRPYITLAHHLMEERKFDEAEPLLERARKAKILHPVDGVSALHFELGLLYSLTHRLPESRVELERALAASPLNPQQRISILGMTDVFPEAEWLRILADGEKLQPREPTWSLFRGMHAFRHRRFAEAVHYWVASIARVSPTTTPYVWQARLDYAQALARVGRLADAQSILHQLLADPALRDPRIRKDARDMLAILQAR